MAIIDELRRTGMNTAQAPYGSRGLEGLRAMIPKIEAMGFKQAQPADPSGAAGLKAMIPQMEAMGFKQNPQYLADGGKVNGPGTATSDSIKARLSKGEYVLPADTVQAVGVNTLDALRNATHTPIKGEREKAARGFFAGGTPGGLDEAYRSWQSKKQPWYMPTPRGNMEERTAEAVYTQALRNFYSGNSSPSATGQPGGPSPKSAPAPDVPPAQSAPQQSAFDANTAKDKTYGLAPLGNKNPPPANPPPAAPHATTNTNPTDMRPAEAPAFDFDTFQPKSGEGAFRNEQTGRVIRLQSEPTGARQQLATPPRGLARYASEPQRQDVRAPVLNPNGGVFSSMVDFTNQAGQAMQAIAANKGMRNDRKDALDQQRVGLDAASTLAKIDQGYQSLGFDGRRADTADRLAGVQEGELGLKREAQGFQTRAASRLEDLQNSYIAEQDPAKRSSIVQRMRDLQGKDAPPTFKSHVMPNIRNADGSTTLGGVYQENLRTGGGQWVQPQGQGGAVPIDQSQQAIAIRDNPSLSREQKVEALRKLGYQ